MTRPPLSEGWSRFRPTSAEGRKTKTVPISKAKARLSSLLEETAAVRSNAELVAEIRRGLRSLVRGKAKFYTLEDLFGE